METNKCHIYNLENTLVTIDRKVWIIEKCNPSKPLLKIEESDFKMIKSGIFRSHENKIEYNGNQFYLHQDMVDKIHDKCGKKEIDLDKIGVSMREYIDKDYIDDTKFKILTGNITHLRNLNDAFYVISSKLIEDKYTKLTRELTNSLYEEGIKIEKIYFVNENLYNQDESVVSYKKSIIILQHLFGLKIKDKEFINESVERYNEVNYYDSVDSNINYLKYINEDFIKVYENTKDKGLKDVINTILNNCDLEVVLNLVTTNELKRFNKTDINIELVVKESYIKRFKDFI